MQIQISWLLKKPTDLDLHCLQRQGISGFSMTRVNELTLSDGSDDAPAVNEKRCVLLHVALCMKFSADDILNYFSYFSKET